MEQFFFEKLVRVHKIGEDETGNHLERILYKYMKLHRIYLRESRKRYIEHIGPTEGRLIQFLMAAAAILIALLLTFQNGIYFHGDIAFHMGRIESLYLGLRNGIFPLKAHPSLANSFGYGEGSFYPDTILYFPALLQLAGVSLEGSFKIFSGAMILLAWFLMYVTLRRLLRKRHSFLWGFGASIYIEMLNWRRKRKRS